VKEEKSLNPSFVPLSGELTGRKNKRGEMLVFVERFQTPKYDESSIMYWKMKKRREREKAEKRKGKV
jgi:hypothetical protein